MSYYFFRMIKGWSKTSRSRTLLTMSGSKMDWKFPATSFAFFLWMDVTLYVCRFQFPRNLTCAEWFVEDHAQTWGDLVLHSFMSWGGIPSGPSAFDVPSLFGQLITSPTDTSACKCSVIAISNTMQTEAFHLFLNWNFRKFCHNEECSYSQTSLWQQHWEHKVLKFWAHIIYTDVINLLSSPYY